VACYLEEDVAKDTLKKMADISGRGSIITMDFYSKVFLKGETSRAMKKSADLMKKMGEPWIFGIDMSEDAKRNVESLLKESGLALKNLVLFGGKNKTYKTFYAIAEAERR
jgi:O-methyltransferase involved in polyketide biosynthesis